MISPWIAGLALLAPAVCSAALTNDIPDIRVELIAKGFERPVHLTSAHDGSGRIFVTLQDGRIRALNEKSQMETAFLNIRDRVDWGGEKGLLSVAFHPRFRENHRFFVDYTTKDGGQLWSRISEFTANVDGSKGIDSSERILMTFRQPYANHNGGHVQFGPDGYLYFGNGDGGAANDPNDNAQNLGSVLGKILRIDVDKKAGDLPYAIPPDNPFVKKQGARPEIFAYGLRNPWRFCFDSANGRMFCGDVGQWTWEEVDLIEKGRNYGWRIMEGNHCNAAISQTCETNGLVVPIAEYNHQTGVSVTGGFVYRGHKFPALDGIYFYADFGSGSVWGLRHDGTGVTAQRQVLSSKHAWSSFGTDDEDELYLVSYDGGIYRIEAESH